jgi:beta-N-acetylhexosaminidase
MAAKELRHMVGEILIVGVEGTQLTGVERAWIKLIQPGGVILFRRNIDTVDQTRELLNGFSQISPAAGFRCVDVEGGLVDRLRDVMAAMPSAAAVAATGSKRLWQKHGELIGRETSALGFNTTLAPVLDLALPASADLMKTRVASADPTMVSEYASAFLKGLRNSGVLGCGKHFPGLGGGTLDSHVATPVIDRSMDALWREDLLPYRNLRRELPMVMVSHAAYAGREDAPASVSSFWIRDVLRKKIGYNGLVLTDDMEMGGVLKHAPMEEAAVAAVLAGNDLVEICHSAEMILRAFEALLSEAERSGAFRKILVEANRRVVRAKKKLLSRRLPMPNEKQVERLRQTVHEFAAQVETAGRQA